MRLSQPRALPRIATPVPLRGARRRCAGRGPWCYIRPCSGRGSGRRHSEYFIGVALGVLVGVVVAVVVGVALDVIVGVGDGLAVGVGVNVALAVAVGVHGGPLAPANVDRVHPPAFPRAADIAGHSPAQPTPQSQALAGTPRRNEATRVAAPCLTATNRAATVNTDRAVIAAYKRGLPPASRISWYVWPWSTLISNTPPSKARLGSTSDASRLKFCRKISRPANASKIVNCCESRRLSLINSRIINECGVGWRIRRRDRHSRIRSYPEVEADLAHL